MALFTGKEKVRTDVMNLLVPSDEISIHAVGGNLYATTLVLRSSHVPRQIYLFDPAFDTTPELVDTLGHELWHWNAALASQSVLFDHDYDDERWAIEAGVWVTDVWQAISASRSCTECQ